MFIQHLRSVDLNVEKTIDKEHYQLSADVEKLSTSIPPVARSGHLEDSPLLAL
jgi:hypothetical protein